MNCNTKAKILTFSQKHSCGDRFHHAWRNKRKERADFLSSVRSFLSALAASNHPDRKSLFSCFDTAPFSLIFPWNSILQHFIQQLKPFNNYYTFKIMRIFSALDIDKYSYKSIRKCPGISLYLGPKHRCFGLPPKLM